VKKKVAVLGVTGSIGKSALDVIARGRDGFEPVLLSAHTNRESLDEAGRLWPRAEKVLSGTAGGREKLLEAIARCGADITLNGISGAAGLEPSMAAIEAGSDLALANKETLVMAGDIVIKRAREKNVNIIPVDSEHSAVFCLIEAHGVAALDEIILTASGGPFRNSSVEEMEKAGPAQALAHPTWNMGAKITIDSASMANKGLEVIEAARRFGLPPEKIKVVIHPQSLVHSMIRMKDGAVYAQMSNPDMRLPIQKALYWPETAPSSISKNLTTEYCCPADSLEFHGGREDFRTKTPCNSVYSVVKNSFQIPSSGVKRLEFDSLSLEFHLPDTEKFPMLALAYEAAGKGGLYPCAYNAANEEAVAAFLEGRIGFLEIGRITRYVLDKDWSANPAGIASVMEADRLVKSIVEKEF
jgi:1-deoxy-D-xylulose-5-phosphate reductoisomerase